MKNFKFYYITHIMFLCASSLHAQEIMLWRVSNNITPTNVPPYKGQQSPFPFDEKSDSSSTAVTPEMLEKQRALSISLEKTQKLIKSIEALAPEIGQLQIAGRIEGARNTKVLISNQWVGVGRQLKLRVAPSPKILSAFEDLKKYDQSVATELESQFLKYINDNPYMEFKIKSINENSVDIESKLGVYKIEISRPGII